jgi:zinc transport system permease protein
LWFMGALLSSALIILPAATARRLTDRLSQFMIVSMMASALAVGFGFLFNSVFFRTSAVGPTIVIVSAFFFACSLLAKKA